MFADLSLRIPGGSKSLHKYAGVKFWAEAGLAKGTTVGVGSQYEGWSAYMVGISHYPAMFWPSTP